MITERDENLFDGIWKDGLITFDTCSFGRLYEWEYNKAIDIKDAISYLLTNGHIWETEVNCEEFRRQRIEIKKSIFAEKYENIFRQLPKRPVPWGKIDGALKRWEKRGYDHEFISELDKYRNIKNISENQIEDLRKIANKKSDLPDAEILFEEILKRSDITLSEDEKKNSKKRFDLENSICPGSEDKRKKNGNKYNDLYIWELLKKKSIKEKKDMIFVTSDIKPDWFENDVAKIEYIKEFNDETNNNIIILSLIDFWECCKKYIDLPVNDFIQQSSIISQIEEKYDDMYEPSIYAKVEELIFESEEITRELEKAVDCCVDEPVIDQINQCDIEDIIPLLDEYDKDDEDVNVLIQMIVDISLTAKNHSNNEDWEAGSASISFYMTVLGHIPIEWTSEDTNRIVLEDTIIIDEINDITVIPDMEEYDMEEYDMEGDDMEEDYMDYNYGYGMSEEDMLEGDYLDEDQI